MCCTCGRVGRSVGWHAAIATGGLFWLAVSVQGGVVIDGFTTHQSLTALAGATVGGSVAAPEVLGGSRGLEVTSSGPGDATVTIGGDYGRELASSLGWRTTGTAVVSYNGLGGVDFLTGGSTLFSLGVVTENQTGSPGVELILRVSSFGGASGSVTQSVEPAFDGVVDFPFAAGGFSGVDFSAIESIALTIRNSSSPGLDMGLTSFALDGQFIVVPELGTWFGGLAALGVAVWGLRRRAQALPSAA